jgi:hypothetical protein
VLAASVVGEGRDGKSGDEGSSTGHVEDAVVAGVEDRSGSDGGDGRGETAKGRGESSSTTADARVEELGGGATEKRGSVREKGRGKKARRTRRGWQRRAIGPSNEGDRGRRTPRASRWRRSRRGRRT